MAKHLRRTPTGRKVSRALTVPLVLATAVAGFAAPAFAGKPAPSGGTGGSGNSLSVVVKSGPDNAPNWGETITFSVTSTVDQKWVELDCSQNGSMVFSQTAGFYPGYPWSTDYVLSSNYWTGGAASCTAKLYTTNSRGRQSTLATLSVAVGA